MEHVAKEQDDLGAKSEDDDDEIDIIGIKTEDIQVDSESQESFLITKDDSIQQAAAKLDVEDIESQAEINFEKPPKVSLEHKNELSTARSEDNVTINIPECDVLLSNEHKVSTNLNNKIGDDEECSSHSVITSAFSSRISSRRNSVNDSETIKNMNEDFDTKFGMFDGLNTHQISDDDDDDDGNKQYDPYERFFFESDYLALKDNKHYHLLLQTLVALEGQRMQSIKDLDILCKEEEKALDDPIRFVEKLQNNEPLGLPSPQNVVKLPKIPWEIYATSLGPVDMSFPMQRNTRASTSTIPEKATQEPQPTVNLFTSEAAESNTSETIFNEAVKHSVHGKVPSFNQPWTTAEQTRLEKLLQVYPQEDIESKRWEKIAKALGNRTPKQVASRIQKYFIKLAKAGLPIPGRVPNIPRSGSRTAKRSSHYQTIGFRNSTFFPSYQPRVYMDDNRDDDESSVTFSDDTSYLSDDESIPEELKQSHDYMELLELKRIKKQKIKHGDQQSSSSHVGFMCDGCGTDPIVGTRWHCQDCPRETSVDFCSSCIDRGLPESRGHSHQHRFEPITKAVSFFIDGDYVGNTSSTGTGYNYLDPNFLPAAS